MASKKEDFLIALVSDEEKKSVVYEAFLILDNTVKHSRVTIGSSQIEDLTAMMPSIVIFDCIDEKLISNEIISRVKEISPFTHFIYFTPTFNEKLFEKVILKKIDYCICYEQFSPKLLSDTVVNILSKVLFIKRISKIIISGNDISINLIDRKVWKMGKSIYLTNFEYDILKLLLENQGKYFKKDDIIKQVWGYDRDNTGLVSQYVFKLKQKIGQENIANSPHKGYCFKIGD